MHLFAFHHSHRRDRSRFAVAAALSLVCGGVGFARLLPAQEGVPQQPERVGADAPHQERNPTQRPKAYLLRPAPAPVAIVETDAVKVKVGNELPPNVVAKKKKTRANRRAAVAERTVPVRKAEPVGPSPEEIAAEREARRAELRRPMRVGNDAPHYERSANPDESAGRILSIERP